MISHLCHLLAVHPRQVRISDSQDLISTTQALILGSRKAKTLSDSCPLLSNLKT